MPYPRAYLYLIVLLVITVPAFWPSYFAQLGSVTWHFHAHGITASLWLALLIGQSWSIHHRRRAAHRMAGKASLVLGPAFLAGSLIMIGQMAAGAGPFRAMYGHQLAIVDLIAVAGFAGFLLGGLWNRRIVAAHAPYMLATAFLLFSPIVSRLLANYLPGLAVRAIEDLPRFGPALHISQVLGIALALFLWFRARPQGRAFGVAAAILVLQSVMFETVGRSDSWAAFVAELATVSPLALALAGISLGAIVVVLGWMGPRRSAQQALAP